MRATQTTPWSRVRTTDPGMMAQVCVGSMVPGNLALTKPVLESSRAMVQQLRIPVTMRTRGPRPPASTKKCRIAGHAPCASSLFGLLRYILVMASAIHSAGRRSALDQRVEHPAVVWRLSPAPVCSPGRKQLAPSTTTPDRPWN